MLKSRTHFLLGITSIVISMCFSFLSFSNTYSTSGGGGIWNDPLSWNNPPGVPPNPLPAGDTIIIDHDLTMNNNYEINGVLIISSGATLDANNRSLTVNGSVLINGVFEDLDEIENYGEIINNGFLAVNDDILNAAGGNITNSNGSTIIVEGELENEECSSVITNNGVVIVNEDIENNGTIQGNGIFDVNGEIENDDCCAVFSGPLTIYTCEDPYEIDNDCGTVEPTVTVLNCVLLPIELLSFEGFQLESSVELKWETSSERNNDYFTLEKSKDGVNFEELSLIPGAGNSNELLSYSYIDENPHRGISYYRLKQTDFDGSFTYSDIISVSFENENNITIYPNPNNGDEINLNLNGTKSQEIILEIYNSSGKNVFSKILKQEKGISEYRVNMENKLASGMYIIVGMSDLEVFREKLIVKQQ